MCGNNACTEIRVDVDDRIVKTFTPFVSRRQLCVRTLGMCVVPKCYKLRMYVNVWLICTKKRATKRNKSENVVKCFVKYRSIDCGGKRVKYGNSCYTPEDYWDVEAGKT